MNRLDNNMLSVTSSVWFGYCCRVLASTVILGSGPAGLMTLGVTQLVTPNYCGPEELRRYSDKLWVLLPRFDSLQCPDPLWDQHSLLSKEYRGPSTRRSSGRGVKLMIHFPLVPRSRTVELYLHSPMSLHATVLN
jgi:hypothetical protein